MGRIATCVGVIVAGLSFFGIFPCASGALSWPSLRAAAEAEVTKETVETRVDHRDQEGVLQELPHRVPGLLKVQGLVAEAADGDIQEGKPQDHPQEVPLVSPLAGPLPIHDRYVEITCRENVNGHLKTASFGTPPHTLHVL